MKFITGHVAAKHEIHTGAIVWETQQEHVVCCCLRNWPPVQKITRKNEHLQREIP